MDNLKYWTVNKKHQDKFAKLGLIYPEQLILHLPVRYDDESKLNKINALEIGSVQHVEASILDRKIVLCPRKQLIIFLIDEFGSLLRVRLLNFHPAQFKTLEPGERLRVLGKVRMTDFGPEMVHPKIRLIKNEEVLKKTLTPIYATTAGLHQSTLRSAIDQVLMHMNTEEALPSHIWQQFTIFHSLPSFSTAIRTLHHPSANTDRTSLLNRTHIAWKRIKLDELIAHQIAFGMMRLTRSQFHGVKIGKITNLKSTANKIIASLPFQLTQAQIEAVANITHDMTQERSMYRLLQGDVGCGKSIVAALVAAQVLDVGWQVVIMVPTSLLAEQHYEKMYSWFVPLGFRVVMLSSSQSKSQKALVCSQIATGKANLIIGTQALIQKNVNFFKLGLVIIDEQHRFGVEQRLALQRKAIIKTQELVEKEIDDKCCMGNTDKLVSKGLNEYCQVHQLMISATPIPRTLAMSYFSSIDISTIYELPPNRGKVLTRLINNQRRTEVIARIRAAVNVGKQIYWVCPLIEESERLNLVTAVDIFQNLCVVLPDIKIGLLHSQLSSLEKQRVMAQFSNGNIHLLVTTTVIEVGVDVPNASLMIIEHAERFGLAQLHQLRGRIGRGSDMSICLLLYQNPLSPIAQKRLHVIRDCSDGFIIAERDLELRGPGDFFGTRQSGTMLLRFANFEDDVDLFDAAKKIATRLLEFSLDDAKKYLFRWFQWVDNNLLIPGQDKK